MQNSTQSNEKIIFLQYYCAGVNLSGTIKPMHPKVLHGMIVKHNAAIFDAFIEFPKPILIALNGPAIGACVTSATLCDESKL